jgi:hypothetical protein
MIKTLGDALTAGQDGELDLKDSAIEEGIDKAREKLQQDSKKFNEGSISGALEKAVMAALDIALDDILGQAWSGWHKIRKYADPGQTPPDDINIVPLSDHKIESVHEPSVDVVVGGVTVHKFAFKVAAQLEVQGVNLVVQNGMIQEIRLASLKCGGSVKLRGRTLLEQSIGQVTIPGVMRLENPIPILTGDVPG